MTTGAILKLDALVVISLAAITAKSEAKPCGWIASDPSLLAWDRKTTWKPDKDKNQTQEISAGITVLLIAVAVTLVIMLGDLHTG
jgi:hypothetical protein